MTNEDTGRPPRRVPRARRSERATADSGPEQGAELPPENGNGVSSSTPRQRAARPSERAKRAASADERDGESGRPDTGPAAAAARRAVRHVAQLCQHDPEGVVSIERRDGGWEVGVEVLEAHRIPDTSDILAVYLVQLRADGELGSYRRIRRYARGQLDWRWP
jgi:hypothetical protein